MTRIDFYILADQAAGDRYHLACRLAEKAWQKGRRIYIHTQHDTESRHIDRLLWTFREGSFVPHGLISENDPELTPILIGSGDEVGNEHDVLISLTTEAPAFFSRFERVAELIDHDAEVKKAGRDRYRLYRDRGYTLNTHSIER